MCGPSKVSELYVVRDRHATGVHLEYLEPAGRIGQANFNFSVESTGPPQGWVDPFRAIGRSNNYDLSSGFETVH